MKRPRVAWFLALATLALLVAVSAPAFPQTSGSPAPAPAPQDQNKDKDKDAGDGTVDKILKQQEEVLRGQRTYDADGRRDPFRSLLENVRLQQQGPRPKGVAGMLVTELDLVGIVRDPTDGDVAMVTGSDGKGYFLRVGDGIYDATVIAVDPRQGSITFRQAVDDPRLIKPYRDVVKSLALVEDEESVNE